MAPPKFITYEEELKKNPELKDSDIQMLREWNDKQPHLPKIPDLELALFLHSNYYLMEPTKTTIDCYYTVRTHVPEFFSNRNFKQSKELQKTSNVAATTPLKGTTNEGHKIIFWKLIDTDSSQFVHIDILKYYSMIFDVWLHSEGTTSGHVIIADMAGLSLGHCARLSPLTSKKFMVYLQDALPVRLKGLHFMNSNAAMDVLLQMIKPLMKKELTDVLHVHTNSTTLAKHIDLDILPNEAGGKAGPLSEFHELRKKELEDYKDWFENDEKTARVQESLRPGKAKNATDLFGVEGSFKKLDID
ncbi:alpha-tocopherol transfer protein-like [Leptopilina boulardi]|uniref:alpha-tocopherol transfer protein-like n=1 Tax=Leptopilina boulardi TaxID=63433 RepID=UPI0021F60D6D|nr:alpha-tocopherol transfer protein-like [Leptopilina boulardi]XP_051169189.1 alpha-tocopherol transfer protein-like [Leptopilina boulardi]